MKIGIQPLLPTGNYLNKRYSIEQDFPDNSHPADNFKYLHELVIAIHMSEYPLLYKDGKPLYSNFSSYKGEEEPVIQKREDKKLTGFEYWTNEINQCTTIEKPNGIESFRTIADSNPKLKEIFNNRLKELQNAAQ